jgi:xanthine dehydrogenase accessory factor
MIIAVKGAGEMASAATWRLYMAGFRAIFMMENATPLAVRREVSFCEAVHDGFKTVEDVQAVRASGVEQFQAIWEAGKIAVTVDPQWDSLRTIRPDVLVDAILAKKNLGTRKEDAGLVIGLGPGFAAGEDVHFVIETNRGHHLGRILTSGSAEPNTGIPGKIAGVGTGRVLRAPAAGAFQTIYRIGDPVKKGAVLGDVEGVPVVSGIGGVLRGLIRPGTWVRRGQKIGDIDPRGEVSYCFTISDKARAIAGSVLEAVLRVYNRPGAEGFKVQGSGEKKVTKVTKMPKIKSNRSNLFPEPLNPEAL